jgi:hypothetical protein
MTQPGSNCPKHASNSFGNVSALLQLRAFTRRCRRRLVCQDRPCKTPPTDEFSLSSRYSDVVSDHDEFDRLRRVGDGVLFFGEAEEEDIACAARIGISLQGIE